MKGGVSKNDSETLLLTVKYYEISTKFQFQSLTHHSSIFFVIDTFDYLSFVKVKQMF